MYAGGRNGADARGGGLAGSANALPFATCMSRSLLFFFFGAAPSGLACGANRAPEGCRVQGSSTSASQGHTTAGARARSLP